MKITWFLLFLQVSSLAFAQSEFQLRKLSLHLRGQPLSVDEKREFANIRDQQQRLAYFERKKSEFLKSPQFAKKMSFHLSERFWLKISERESLSPSLFNEYELQRSDALTDLFYRMALKNQSWDQLLLGNEYLISTPHVLSAFGNSGSEDLSFFSSLTPVTKEQVQSNSFAQTEVMNFGDHPAIAGALTTHRFLSRYQNTAVNKNRRRAAAIFRIFLCEPISAVIPSPEDKKTGFLNSLHNLEISSEASEDQIKQLHQSLKESERHATDPRCATCHDRLDPMGRIFQPYGISLNPITANGRLYYKKTDGARVDVPVRGPRQLGQAITQQSEYVDCQVKWFWNTFIGNNVPLYPDRLETLAKDFDRVGRRTQDFVNVIINQPEFFQKPENPLTVSHAMVRPLLKRCDSCHVSEPMMPTYSSGTLTREELLAVKDRLNRAPHQKGRMPRNWIDWDSRDLELIKKWVDEELK